MLRRAAVLQAMIHICATRLGFVHRERTFLRWSICSLPMRAEGEWSFESQCPS